MVGRVFEWYWGLAIVIVGMICVWMGATLRAPFKQRNQARALLERELKPIPLQDRDKLIGTIVDVTTIATELIKRKRKLLSEINNAQGGLHPNDKKAKFIVSEINEAGVEYYKALAAVNREKQIVGEPYETPINSLLILITIGVGFWYSEITSGSDYYLTYKSILEKNKTETIKMIEKFNQQASHKEGS